MCHPADNVFGDALVALLDEICLIVFGIEWGIERITASGPRAAERSRRALAATVDVSLVFMTHKKVAMVAEAAWEVAEVGSNSMTDLMLQPGIPRSDLEDHVQPVYS